MRLLRPTLAVVLVASMAAIASAQVRNVPANPRALPALQQDLITAIESMRSALPIYDGNRVRSIRAAHRTLLLVDIAIAGRRAPKRKAPDVNDSVGSKGAKGKYSAQQIQESQTNMRQGLIALQTAWKDLQTAAGSNPNKQGLNAGKNLQSAITEAQTAISLHAAQG